jgi:anti-anti-sigma regulatory factor
MAFEKKDTSIFTYLFYKREHSGDFEAIKRELLILTSKLSDGKDIILDLSSLSTISSVEIGFVARIINTLKGSTRQLRIVANGQIKRMLDSTGITKLPNLIIYETREQFVEEIKKIAPHENPATQNSNSNQQHAAPPPAQT